MVRDIRGTREKGASRTLSTTSGPQVGMDRSQKRDRASQYACNHSHDDEIFLADNEPLSNLQRAM